MTEQWPGPRQEIDPGPDWGVRVIEPGFPSAAGGWWDNFGAIGCCIGAWQAKAAASYAASLLDLSGNGNNLVEGAGAVPWDPALGWQFLAAATQYFDTLLIPAADQSWSMLLQFNALATAWTWLAGARSPSGPDYFHLRSRGLGVGFNYANGAAFNGVLPGVLAGNVGIAGAWAYLDGAPDGGPGGGWVGPSTASVYIASLNRPPMAPTGYVTANIESVAIYNCVLNAGEVAAVAAAMAAL